MGSTSRVVWEHLSLHIFPKLHQDTPSLCDLTKCMSRFLKLITDVPGKTALEVRDFFFLPPPPFFSFFFFLLLSFLFPFRRGRRAGGSEHTLGPPLAHPPAAVLER